MGLPPRCYFTLYEVSARWGCLPADIAGWAANGMLELLASLAPVRSNGDIMGGVVAIPATDVLPMFRRCGTGPDRVPIFRFREPGGAEWRFITDPPQGVAIAAADIVIAHAELERFEDEHSILRPQRMGGPGANPKWDWEAFYAALIRRIHERGLPETQSELITDMQAWFERRSETGEAPDESTIRKRIQTIWRELRG